MGEMGRFEVGVAIGAPRSTTDWSFLQWAEMADLAGHAEAVGFDTLWVEDGLILRFSDGQVVGFWDAVALAAGIAARTTRAKIGTWVLSALNRPPAMIAKAAATLDELSGARFVLGIGTGDRGSATRAFGIDDDHVHDRYAEALQILVPLLREGHADFDGTYHVARDLVQIPAGPRPGGIPLMLAAHGPRGYRLAARHADTWSCYGERTSTVEELGPRLVDFKAACAEVGRDPASIGRSAGVIIAPTSPTGTAGAYGTAITGSPAKIADELHRLVEAGFTQIEVLLHPLGGQALDVMGHVLEELGHGTNATTPPTSKLGSTHSSR